MRTIFYIIRITIITLHPIRLCLFWKSRGLPLRRLTVFINSFNHDGLANFGSGGNRNCADVTCCHSRNRNIAQFIFIGLRIPYHPESTNIRIRRMIVNFCYILFNLIKFRRDRIICFARFNAIFNPSVKRVTMLYLITINSSKLHNIFTIEWQHVFS